MEKEDNEKEKENINRKQIMTKKDNINEKTEKRK